MRTLALPKEVEHWSLTTLRKKLIKIGAKVVSHSRYVTFQLAEVAVPKELFRKILSLIDGLRPAPLPPWRRLIQVHPSRPTGQICAAQVGVRPPHAKWSRGRVSHRQISPIESAPQPIVAAQGQIRGRMLIVVSFSVIGSSHLGNPSLDEEAARA